MSHATQLMQEEQATSQLDRIEEKLDETLRLQREIAAFANSLATVFNGFDASSIPAPFRAMLGLGK